MRGDCPLSFVSRCVHASVEKPQRFVDRILTFIRGRDLA
jgi:hypothetical protein